MIECPNCKGEKQHAALIDYADGTGGLGMVACSLCNGTGEVDDAFWTRIEWASPLGIRRRAAGVTLGAASDRLGIGVARLSGIERGAVIPTDEERARLDAETWS